MNSNECSSYWTFDDDNDADDIRVVDVDVGVAEGDASGRQVKFAKVCINY